MYDDKGITESHYVVEKLTNALECLATHPGDARERVAAAYLACHALREEDFPVEFKKDWSWIERELTKYGPLEDPDARIFRGSVENTMRRVRKTTGAKIAKKIYDLYWGMSNNQLYR